MGQENFDPNKNANTAAEQAALSYAAKINPSGKPIDDPIWDRFNQPLPYPGAPHDGGPQDLANQKQVMANQNNYNSYNAAVAAKPGFWDKLIPAFAIGLSTAGIGSGVGAAAGDALGSTAAGGAIGGATAAGLGAAVQGQNPLKSAAIGALTGGIGASGIGQNASGALSDATGLSAPIASGLVRGGIGAAGGALAGKLSGTSPSNGAIVGGLGGAASGLIGGATGSNAAGQIGGITAATLAGKYLTSPPKPVTAAPAIMGGTALPTLPGQPPVSQPSAVTPTSSNIGPYSGYGGLGYQPRQEANMSGVDWATYGQGPEQNFFVPAGSAPAVPSSGTTPGDPQQRMNVNQGVITRTNST